MKTPAKYLKYKDLSVRCEKCSLIFCISEFLLHKAKPDLTLVDVNNNTALHLACSKVTYTHTNACTVGMQWHNNFCMPVPAKI